MAITNGDLFRIALDINKRDSKGMAVTPDTIGFYLDWAQRQYFEQEFMKYESSRRIGDTLLPFVVRGSLALTTPRSLPSDYKHVINARVNYAVSSERVDIVTIPEYEERRDNVLTAPSGTSPVMYLYRGSADKIDTAYKYHLDTGSSTPVTVTLTYLRVPPSCIFDYYINAEGEVVYLDEKDDYALGTDEEYRDGTDSGTVSSISKELWWNDHDKLKILEMVLMKLGVKMENGAVMQYSGMQIQTNQVQP